MNIKLNKVAVSFALLAIAAVLHSCIIKYSFTGASIPQEAKTFSVAYFPNNAPMVSPTLSNTFTEALKDKFLRQTKLTQVPEEGDFALEGEITGYITAPTSVSAEEYAIQNRLTITVQVRFNNVYNPTQSFTNGKSFSAFTDYDTNIPFLSIEEGLNEEIIETLVDNIFNACASNW